MDKVLNINEFARYVGLSMISKGFSISPLKLQKILYYEQAWFMVFFGRENQLFDCAPEAWVNGPVYPEIYHQYKSCVPGMCDLLNETHFGVASKEGIIPAIEELSKNLIYLRSRLS